MLDPKVGDSHDVLGECSGLIRADIVSSSHGLASVQMSDEIVLLSHLSDGIRQSHGDGQRETLGDGNDHDGDSDDEEVDEMLDGVDVNDRILYLRIKV